MKLKTLLITLILTFTLFSYKYSKGQQTFYDLNTIQKIEVNFTQSNWDYLLDTAKIGSEGYLLAQWVKINGIQFDSVGVKYKGNSSYDSSSTKNPIHIGLDKFKSQSFQNFTDIKLSNCYADPSMIREVLAYSILKNYMDCPRSNFAQLYINGKYMGLYSSDESINKQFASDHFYTSSNTIIKCNPANPGPSAKSNLKYIPSADSSAYANYYELSSTYGWNDVKNLCDSVTNHPTSIGSVLDIDRVLWMLAFDNITVNLDSYSGVFCQNYYLCKDNNNLFNPVIWDLNMAFGGFPYAGYANSSMGTLTVTNMQQLPLSLHSTDVYWPLINDVMSTPLYKRMLVAHARTLTNEMFANNYYQTIASQMLALVDTAVHSDSNKFFSYTQFQNCMTSNATYGSQTIPGITNLMSARVSYLQSTTDFTNTQPVISVVSTSNSAPNLNTSVTITAHVTNTSTNAVYLYYRFNNSDVFFKALMYDDGIHNDTLANDNIYGVSLTMNSALLQYYVYAENSNAGVFSPQRAAHEFYSVHANIPIASPGQVVINEFLALNTADSTNESGSYEDWIELYNTTSSILDLYGLYLTDNYSKPTKFSFPSNSLMPPHGYLMIWADDGTSNTTYIHSNFKLSGSGEQIMLSDGNGTVLDSITFGAQTNNISMGRCPDGTGTFVLLNSPTFNATNACPQNITSLNKPINNISIYPNPANDFINIFSKDNSKKDIEIMNTIGEIIYKGQFMNNSKINTQSFKPGLYVLRCGETVKKVLISH